MDRIVLLRGLVGSAWWVSTNVYGLVRHAIAAVAASASSGASGRRRSSTIEDIRTSIEELRKVRDLVHDRETELGRRVGEHEQRAKHLCVDLRDTESARVELRLWRIYRQQRTHVRKLRTTLESHVVSLENAVINHQVYGALRSSLRAVDGHGMDEDKVDDVVEDIAEAHQKTYDIMQQLNCQAASFDLVAPAQSGEDDEEPDPLIASLLQNWQQEQQHQQQREQHQQQREQEQQEQEHLIPHLPAAPLTPPRLDHHHEREQEPQPETF